MKILLYDSFGDNIGYLIGFLVILIVVFLVLRELMLWYWKVNVIIREMQELNANIKILVKASGHEPAGINTPPSQLTTKEIKTEDTGKKGHPLFGG